MFGARNVQPVAGRIEAGPGWRQALVNRPTGEILVIDVREWVLLADPVQFGSEPGPYAVKTSLYPVGPEGDLGERFSVARVISPLCKDSEADIKRHVWFYDRGYYTNLQCPCAPDTSTDSNLV
jgi:hypothetical protein